MPCLRCRFWPPVPGPGHPSDTYRGDGAFVGLASADADCPLEGHHEDLSVADLSCASALAQGIDRLLNEWISDGDLEADLVRKADLHRRSAVCLNPVKLTAVALDSSQRDPGYFRPVEGFQHVVRLFRTNDSDHQFHGTAPFQKRHAGAV